MFLFLINFDLDVILNLLTVEMSSPHVFFCTVQLINNAILILYVQLLDKALANPEQAKFMVPEEIERFRNFGGVRIEDDVIITEDGVENMTKVPRT
jgi:hypothetical protein